MTLLLELSVIVKYGSTMFDAPFPWYVKVMWMVIGSFLILGGVVAYRNERVQMVKDHEKLKIMNLKNEKVGLKK